MAPPRTKGLTPQQRRDGLLFMRPDTIVDGNLDLPIQQADLGEPSDGTDVQWWADMSNGGAHISAEGDPITYHTTPGGIRIDDNETLRCLPGLTDRRRLYFERPHSGSFTWATLLQVDTAAGSEYPDLFVLGEGGNHDVGLSVGMHVDPPKQIHARLGNGSGSFFIWNSDSNDHTVSYSTSGYDELWISQDATGGANTVQVGFNDQIIFEESGFSLLAPGTPPDRILRVGNDTFGWQFVGFCGGFVLDTIPNRGPAAIDWLRGNNYTP